MNKTDKVNKFLSTLNFVLCFVGYQFITSVFLPTSSDIEGISRTVTVPYRAIALLISFLVIFLNYKYKVGKISLALKVLWIYWFFLIIRIFYDSNLRTDIHFRGNFQELWLYIFGIILPAMYSVMKSYRVIDLDKSLNWVYIGTILTMLFSLLNNPELLIESDDVTVRFDGNVALNTISFGHLGTMGIVLSFFILSKGRNNLIRRILIISVIILSFFIVIRSGSRSPLLALMVIILVWLFSRSKYVFTGLSIIAAFIILLITFIDPILQLISNISPIMESRLRNAIFENDSSGRDVLYESALKLFMDKPILGSQFALFNDFGGFIYPHNIVLEAFMALGFIGGIAMIFILWKAFTNSYFSIKYNNAHSWICLILIQQIVLAMLGQFYYNQILNVLLVFVLLKKSYVDT